MMFSLSVPFCPPFCFHLSFCPSVHLPVCPIHPEYGLVRLVGRPHHPAGVPGGEESSGLLRSQGAAADEGQQQPERGAPAAPEGGRKRQAGAGERADREFSLYFIHFFNLIE